ncbi:MAG TPA: DUF397 domain-containing protein [Candidatus Saccharimonadia bacterium]|nr:DUF397 domain-containing protein [Candidatus Saccharimonadia bacterium]
MSTHGQCSAEGWKRSRFCDTGGCVEVNFRDGLIHVRDSKDPNGPELVYTVPEWRAFVKGARVGDFNFA